MAAPIDTEASINLIHQHTSDSQITPETTFSMDLNLEYKFLETDLISFHLEASSTSQKKGYQRLFLTVMPKVLQPLIAPTMVVYKFQNCFIKQYVPITSDSSLAY